MRFGTQPLRFINMDVGVRHAQILRQLRRWCTHVLSAGMRRKTIPNTTKRTDKLKDMIGYDPL